MRAVPWAAGAYWLGIALLAVLAFLWRPRLVMPMGAIDPSWFLAMNQIVVDKLALGNVIFTFGPLSRLYTSQYHPQLFVVHCLGGAALAVLYVWLLHRLVGVSFENRAVKCALMFSLVPLVAVTDVFWYSFAPLGLLVLTIQPRPRDSAFRTFFWFGMAILSLIKSSFGISALFLWTAELCVCVAARRRCWTLLSFPVGALLIWTGEGQSLANLPQFVKNTWFIASGYGEAMERPLPSLSLLWGFWIIVGSSAVPLWHSLSKQRQVRWRGVPVLTYLLLGWSLFKAAFVAGYIELGTVGALLMAAYVWIACWRDSAGAFGRVCFGVSVVLDLAATHNMSELYKSRNVLSYLVDQSKLTAQLVVGNVTDLRKGGRTDAYSAALAELRHQYPLPPLGGSVDVYRTNQSLAFAYEAKWNPRLVFQSYSAYTPALVTQNHQHLLGRSSPDTLVMELVTVDDRYPMLDDGPSLLEILSRYRVTALRKRLAIFAKRAQPIGYRFGPPKTVLAKFDTQVLVPGNDHKPIWAWISFKKSTAGRVAALLYRGAILELEVQLASGHHQRYRIVPGISECGFLLSPLVNDVVSYAFLNDESARPPPASARVVAIDFHVEPGFEWMYDDAISVKMAEVELASVDHAEGFRPRDIAKLTALHWRPVKQ